MDLIDRQANLETGRLILRQWRESDIKRMSLYTSDWRVARMTSNIPFPNPEESVRNYLKSIDNEGNGLAVWVIDASRALGTNLVGMASLNRSGEIGYWVAPFFWGLGLATEAASAVRDHAFASGMPAINAQVFHDNPGSARVLEKVGLTAIGSGTSTCIARGCEVKNTIMEMKNGAA